jgi:hypothetical protein
VAAVEKEDASTERYCRYLPIRIGNVACSALIDSGNLWRNVMSKQFFDRLGLTKNDLRPIEVTQVATAKKGANLKVIGELCQPIYLTVGGLHTKLKTRPVVVDGLTMPFNVCGPFLKQHSIDQLHSRNCLRINGHDVPLMNRRSSQVPGPEAPVSAVYVRQTLVVPAMSAAYVQLRAAEIEAKKMPSGDGVLEGDTAFMEATDTHAWTGAIVSVDDDGRLIGGILNTLDYPITIEEGRRYGVFTRTCSPDDIAAYPWRICTLEKGEAAKIQPPANPDQLDDKNDWSVGQKRKWLKEVFKLEQSPCLKRVHDLEAATSLLLEFWDILSHDGSFGKTSLIQHEIFTPEGVPPIKTRNRPLNPKREEDLRVQMDVWKKHGVIEPSSSPWSFALVAVPKKNGTTRF